MKVRVLRKKVVEHPEVWMRILFISNIFADTKTSLEYIERIAIEASAQNADILLFGGGFVRGSHESMSVLEPLTNIRAHLGRYFVLGDTDYLDDPFQIRSFFTEQHFQDLTNAQISIMKHGRAMRLTGIDDAVSGAPIVLEKQNSPFPHVVFTQRAENVFGEEPDMIIATQLKKIFSSSSPIMCIELGI
ncbi:MAG: hypothetical protein NUV81_04330 [bacterium]|nr:hypothetical protein [bacterium]